VYTPGATGGDKGIDTINAKAVYDDNVLLTDWVFDPEHKATSRRRLYDLAETRTYTIKEHRLPWMPTPAEFERARSLGGMTTRLWQGQEQQQLYIFQLEERIKKLEQQRGNTERAIAAAKSIRFVPATKDGHPVSMWMELQYNFNLY
jgi:hypothetical protein